jgi:deoxyhypusine monooxygenase
MAAKVAACATDYSAVDAGATDWTAVDAGQTDVAGLRAALLDSDCPIATRNRAAYWIREKGAEPEARAALRAGLQLKGDSVLLRHEIAYVLGQLGHADAVDDLCAIVNDVSDDAIVRHEAAEALGAIGDARAMATLVAHCDDARREVSETCRLSVQLVSWRQA